MSDEPSCSNDLDPQLPRCAWLLACSVSRKDASPQSSASARRIPGRILSGNGVHRFRNHCSTSPEYATSFLAAVCRAAHNAGVLTIATRVEDQQQVELLSQLHIDGYQGFVHPAFPLS
ncbi:EAL domain-containing protein [Aeromonas enteropelogenes]|uniref:EAL domain-containing protein n=1 Tax=Aeromonas enteropelogenes TaxID=29489 RepID=UPI003989C416